MKTTAEVFKRAADEERKLLATMAQDPQFIERARAMLGPELTKALIERMTGEKYKESEE